MSVMPTGKTVPGRIGVGGDALVLGALLLLFAGLSYAISTQSQPSSGTPGIEHRSSFSTDPGGWKAYYNLLEKRKTKVRRYTKRPKEWPATAGVVITGPYSVGDAAGQWTSSEAKDALSWVSRGGALVAFTDASDDLTRTLGLRTSEKAPVDFFGRGGAGAAEKTRGSARGNAPQLIGRVFRPRATGTPLSIRQPVLFLEQVSDLKVPRDKRYTAGPRECIVLLGDKLPLALAIPYGKGVIFAIADAGIPDNRHIAKADNARFVTQLAEAYTSKKRPIVLFDEYHQGYRESNTFWTAIGRPGQLAFWQLAGLFLLMAYSASRRFGLPRPLSSPSRLSSEYVGSLADLYRRARAADAALEAVLRIFWRDLCRAAGMPADAPVSEVALRVAGQASTANESERAVLAERISGAILECRAKIEVPETPSAEITDSKKRKKIKARPALSESELLRLVTVIETLREELELGGRSHD